MLKTIIIVLYYLYKKKHNVDLPTLQKCVFLRLFLVSIHRNGAIKQLKEIITLQLETHFTIVFISLMLKNITCSDI